MAEDPRDLDGLSELEAAAGDPGLLGAEAAGRPAFAVDAEGEIVWAGDAAFGLIGTGGLEPATRRTLGRMAASGSGGLLRLRLGEPGARPLSFQARPIAYAGGATVIGLAGLSATSIPSPEPEPIAPATVEPVADRTDDVESGAPALVAPSEDAPEAPADVVAAEAEGAMLAAEELPAPQPEPIFDAPAPASNADRPPDPRVDFGTPIAPAADEAAAEPDPSTAGAASIRSEAGEPFRFAFEIDGASRVALISPELARAVGPSAEAAVGKPWSEVAADLGLDPEGAVEAALARRGSWSDLEISWPVDDGRLLPLSLSALPMFDRGRSFAGFRGLGRSIGAPVSPEPVADVTPPPFVEPVAIEEAKAPETVGAPEPVATVEPIADAVPDAPVDEPAAPEVADAPEPALPEAQERYEPPILVEMTPEAPVFAGNVVPLRDGHSARDPSVRVAPLSSSEESAFDEIARRLQSLGVKIEDVAASVTAEDDAPVVDLDSLAAPVAEAAEHQRELPFAAGPDELLRLIDRLPVGALVLRGGDVAHANRAALDLLGCRVIGDLTGRGADTLFAEALPQDRDAPAGVMRLIAANGGEVEVDARLSTIAWGGAPATLVTLRRPEAALAAAKEIELRERELAAVLDVATDGVMTLDGAGRILGVNRRAEALFGFDAREVLGSLFTLSLAPESRRAAFDRLDALKIDAEAPDGGVEVLGLSRNGGSLPLLMTIATLAGDDDRYCAVLRDVGPWKRAEEELIAARRQAERANAQKSEFLAKVGHEIRTPLNAIIGFAEVMMEERLGPIGSPRYKDYLKDIHTSGGHLVKMVDDLLDITRIETGKLKLDFVAVDLNEIASQAAALLQPQANRDRVIIRTSLARGLPLVLADRRSVRQIMTNLAANAVKLSRPGGQVIVATAMTDVGQAVFRVRDAGAGMSKQEIARAFEPFRPLAVADNDTGFGLGLPLTRALAEANQAALALQSEVGQGTLAEVTFPASRVLAG